MMLKTLLALLAIGISPCFGQRAGTPEAYQKLRQIKTEQLEAADRWRSAKKIVNLKIDEFPGVPAITLTLADIEPGAIGRMEGVAFTVMRHLDDHSLELQYTHRDRARWLIVEGIEDTSKIADGDPARLIGWVEVTKPREFRGRRLTTLRLLGAKEQRAKIAAEETARRDEMLAEFPVWELANGSEFRAKFDRYFASQVEMTTPGFKTVRRKLSEFSDASADQLRALIRDARK